ncbi:Uncharacterised protein [Vibrio cholerae]|nr:Uncharacterised protein [Vibrio cholerae]CSB08021.1 Uncharacterised protein [Vibrio cholerae]
MYTTNHNPAVIQRRNTQFQMRPNQCSPEIKLVKSAGKINK